MIYGECQTESALQPLIDDLQNKMLKANQILSKVVVTQITSVWLNVILLDAWFNRGFTASDKDASTY